jgi:hypothetical protein
MGNEVSKTQSGPIMSRPLPNDHMMMYNKILQIKNPQTRINMLKTILSGPEFIHTAKQAGIYSGILQYIKAITYDEPGMHILPGESAPTNQYPAITNKSSKSTTKESSNAITLMHNGKAQKAKDYFNWSLEILGLNDSDGLTVDSIKAAYKKSAAKAHPDRQGGSEKAFKDVTKAAAYLTDIISKITGRRPVTGSITTDSEVQQRKEDTDKWANFTPVTLDPKNLNMASFNAMFEKTRIPDPDEDGYGDWLKDANDMGNGRLNSKGDYEINKQSSDYNRDNFMRTFEDSLRSNNSKNSHQLVLNPNAMALVAPIGTELGRDRPADYTAPFMSDVNYTDLRSAYTQNNTIMNHVANVRFEERSFDKYKSAYDAGPSALSKDELELIRQSDKDIEDRERQRQLRHAQQDRLQLENSERLRSLLILNKST